MPTIQQAAGLTKKEALGTLKGTAKEEEAMTQVRKDTTDSG